MTRYHIDLRKCEDGKNPVITVSDISAEEYMICLGFIKRRFGVEIKPNGQRQMRKGGGKK